ncbi:MAG: hypothetical protein DWQ37_02695 [Planctomycetota bacterium]|nr:MAG: hypothetical protein DWQ37_02695 [Planctomycetota bacterium]
MWDDSQLDDLLLLFEQRSEQGWGQSVEAICEADRELHDLLDDDPNLREELGRRFERMRQVDQLIAGVVDVPLGEVQHVPGYELLDLIGRGGMGVVYRARDLTLNRTVALKFLLAGRFGSPTLVARFRAEAEAIARLSHPGVVKIYEFGQAAGTPFLALEYVAGANLKQRMAGKPMQPRDAAACIANIARGVEHAHRQGIVHRDIKPSNVLIATDGQPKIMDFGLAKSLKGDWTFTSSGDTPGTPSYMAPEQVTGQAIGPATDVHALGAMLYECLTGRPPFLGATTSETLMQVGQHEPTPPSQLQPRIERDLESVCLHCLEKDPARRYASAGALADDLDRWLSGRVTKARPASPARRLWKWARRRPTLAGMAAVSAAALLVIVALTAEYTRHLRESRATAQRLQAEAEASNLLVRQQSYASNMRTAQWAYESLNYREMNSIVNQFADSDLRGFEWHHLKHRNSLGRLYPTVACELDGVAFSPDERRIATASRDGMIEVRSAPDGAPIGRFRSHEQCANLVRYSPDGLLLATASCDGKIRLWDAESFEMVREFHNPGGPVRAIRFSPQGDRVFSVGDEMIARMWNAATGELEHEFEASVGLQCVAVSPDGSLVAAGGQGEWVGLWNTETGELVNQIQCGDALAVDFIGYIGSDQPLLAIAVQNDAVHLVSVPDGQLRETFNTHGPAHCLAAGPRAGIFYLYCATHRGVVDVWKEGEGVIASLPRHEDRITDVAVSPSGNYLLTSGADRAAVLTDVHRPNPGEIFQRVAVPQGKIHRAALNGHSAKLALAYKDGRVLVRDVGEGGRQSELPRSSSWLPQHVHFSLDGRFLVLQKVPKLETWWLAGQKPVLWDAAHRSRTQGASQRDFHNFENRPEGFSVFDVDDGRTVFAFEPTRGTHFVDFLAGGQLLTMSLNDISVWDPYAGRQVSSATVPATGRAVSLSPQQEMLAVTTVRQTYLFDFPELTPRYRVGGHRHAVDSVAFSPDSKTLATASGGGSIRLWNVASGQQMLWLRGHHQAIAGLSFSKDGKTLWSLGVDHSMKAPPEIYSWETE